MPFILVGALDLLFFEELELGGRWTTRGRTITDSDLAAHAGVTGDFGFLHMDAPRAAQGHFGGRVAHGPLLIGIAIGLGSIDVPQANTVAMVGTSWRFLRPVKAGMTVHAVWRLGRLREVTNPRWGLATWQIELFDQTDEQLMEGEATILVNRRESSGGAADGPVARSRRRRRSSAATPVLVAPTVEANLPEPAPADVPAPARRRRRSSTPTHRSETAAAVPEALGEPGEPVAAPSPTSSSRRRRRRRGGGGSGSSSGGGGNGNGASAAENRTEPAPATAPAPAAESEPPRSQWAAPEAAQPSGGNAVSRALGRLRRPRSTPEAPAPGETRSPSE